MTVTATYLDDLSRVRIEFSDAPEDADYAIIERSTDGITWKQVRGGDEVPVSDGVGHLDDYEFAPNVENIYRVSYVNTGPISMVPAAGTAVTGDNTSLTPPLPASGLRPGDLLLCFASIRSLSAWPNEIDGWSAIVDLGNAGLYARIYQDGDTAPEVTFTGGSAGDDTMAQVTAFHNAALWPQSQTVLDGSGSSTQNMTLPSINVTEPATLDVWLAWKQSSWTGASSGRGFAEIGDWSSSAGNGAAMWWEYTVQGPTSEIDFGNATLTVTGGSAAAHMSASVVFRKADYVIRETATVTPSMSVIWLKNPRRPNLNTKITVTDFSEIVRPARAGLFNVIGRMYPIAVTDVRGGRQFTLTVTTGTLDAAIDLETRLAQGDPVLLHVPAGCPVPGGYYVVGDVTIDRHSRRTLRRFFELPLTEVAAPANSIYSQTATYADIEAAYETYGDLLASEPWYSDVLDYVAPASDIITP